MTTSASASPGVRRRNLARVLTLVHREQGLSRSELTARTGLNRSTVADLVAELARLGLVVEASAPATRRPGRPSPRVEPASGPVALAVNPERDAVTLGIVGLGARVLIRRRVPLGSAPSPDEVVDIVADATAALRGKLGDGHRILGAGLAVPGLVRTADGTVVWAPHLEWNEVPLAARLSAALRISVRAANDASLGASAEHRFGAGRGAADLVYLNGGASGIGGGIIAHGEPLVGVGGYAGEFGHVRAAGDIADLLSDGGALEDEVSRDRLLVALGMQSADESELRAAVLAASDDRTDAAAEIARQRRVLGVAIGGAVAVLAPERVVLGGFLAALRDSDPDDLDARIAAATVPASGRSTRITDAALGQHRLLIGAAELVFAPVLDDPAAPLDGAGALHRAPPSRNPVPLRDTPSEGASE